MLITKHYWNKTKKYFRRNGEIFMHLSQQRWCEELKTKFPEHFKDKKVLEIGSLDINGNNRYLFEDCEYIGLDVVPGKNVDVVSIAHEYDAPDESFDVVMSTNTLEHDMYYPKTLQRMVDLLKPGGFMFFSTHIGPEHGTLHSHPETSGTSQLDGEWANYYKAISINDIGKVLNLDGVFEKYEIGINHFDVQCWGIRREN